MRTLSNSKGAVRARAWRTANPEKAYANSHRYMEKNRERDRKRYAEDPERKAAQKLYMHNWYYANRERAKSRQREYDRKKKGISEPSRPRPQVCECCGGPPNGMGVLHLDHCHTTGEFRGWICHSCNVGMGSLGDDLAGVKFAVEYLERFELTKFKKDI